MTKVLFGIAFDVLFSELYKPTNHGEWSYFLRFYGGRSPSLKPPYLEGALFKKLPFLAVKLLFHTCFFQERNELGHHGERWVSERGRKYLNYVQIVLNFVQHVFPGRRKIFPGARLSPCAPGNGPGFFTHSTNQGWANLFNGRVICRKPKTPASRKTSL